MSSINCVVIARIPEQYTAEYIANVFWNRNIAQVSSITLVYCSQKSKLFKNAYVNIANWIDSEVAYNFIQRLKNTSKETRIVHYDDFWWPVKINKHKLKTYDTTNTTVFPKSYFEQLEEAAETAKVIRSSKKKTNTHPYSDKQLANLTKILKDEINFLEDQLFSKMTLKSQNVTLRPHQKSFVINTDSSYY